MSKAFLAGALALALVSSPAAAEVLATVGKKTIDRAQVEKAVASQLVEVERQRYEALRKGSTSWSPKRCSSRRRRRAA